VVDALQMSDDRLVTPREQPEDGAAELSLRPKRLQEYIGQDKVKANLRILLDAARQRHEPLDHVLLYGPPGLGKTTLASIIAAEMGGSLRITSGPAFERPGDVVSILTNLDEGDVLFVDEIHRLNRVIEETLYPAMEDFAVDFIIGKGPSARTMRLGLKHFTLVGATTRLGLISSPLRDHFGVHYNLEFYDQRALEAIVTRSAALLKIELQSEAAAEIARRSRGTPRVANRLLKRVRDFAQTRAGGVASLTVSQEALAMLEVDPLGLDATDRRLLETVIDKFGGGPVGLDTIAAATNEERDTIEDVYEPFLLQLGFLQRTPRGRVATPRAYAHLGLTQPEGTQPMQQALFGTNS
jgi:Holliday junction DNA helicase RuvB